jgi:succinyl-CoA synthetase beta subunit
MKIHEFQAIGLLEPYGVPFGRWAVARSEREISTALRALGDCPAGYVVKAQVHSGGRGKGHFSAGPSGGGVRRARTAGEAGEAAAAMLGKRLVTAQSGPAGLPVTAVLITEAAAVGRECYLSLSVDRSEQLPVLLASRCGGMDIETLAAERPEEILREWLHPTTGVCQFQARYLAAGLGMDGAELAGEFSRLLDGLFQFFFRRDASLVEINPLAVTADGHLRALDAKVDIDDSALFRQGDILAMRDSGQEDPMEARAADRGLRYVACDGTVACLINGAGLAMATMDMLQAFSLRPANFLDLGDSAGVDVIADAFRLIEATAGVRCILINIFGGTMRGDAVAEGILSALDGRQPPAPCVVRLEGPFADEGRRRLQEHIAAITAVDDLSAVGEAVRVVCGE